MSFAGVRAQVGSVCGMGYWKGIIEILGSTDYYYFITQNTTR